LPSEQVGEQHPKVIDRGDSKFYREMERKQCPLLKRTNSVPKKAYHLHQDIYIRAPDYTSVDPAISSSPQRIRKKQAFTQKQVQTATSHINICDLLQYHLHDFKNNPWPCAFSTSGSSGVATPDKSSFIAQSTQQWAFMFPAPRGRGPRMSHLTVPAAAPKSPVVISLNKSLHGTFTSAGSKHEKFS